MADIDKEYYLGIDIGGTKCAVVVGDGDFNFYREVQFETQKGERGYWKYLCTQRGIIQPACGLNST